MFVLSLSLSLSLSLRLEPQETVEEEKERQFKADKSLFVQELLFSSLVASSPSSSDTASLESSDNESAS